MDLLQRRQLGRGRAHDELAAVVELGPHQGLVEADEDRGRRAAALEARHELADGAQRARGLGRGGANVRLPVEPGVEREAEVAWVGLGAQRGPAERQLGRRLGHAAPREHEAHGFAGAEVDGVLRAPGCERVEAGLDGAAAVGDARSCTPQREVIREGGALDGRRWGSRGVAWLEGVGREDGVEQAREDCALGHPVVEGDPARRGAVEAGALAPAAQEAREPRQEAAPDAEGVQLLEQVGAPDGVVGLLDVEEHADEDLAGGE